MHKTLLSVYVCFHCFRQRQTCYRWRQKISRDWLLTSSYLPGWCQWVCKKACRGMMLEADEIHMVKLDAEASSIMHWGQGCRFLALKKNGARAVERGLTVETEIQEEYIYWFYLLVATDIIRQQSTLQYPCYLSVFDAFLLCTYLTPHLHPLKMPWPDWTEYLMQQVRWEWDEICFNLVS